MYRIWTTIPAFMIFATSGIKLASIEFDTINVSTELVKGHFEKKGPLLVSFLLAFVWSSIKYSFPFLKVTHNNSKSKVSYETVKKHDS